jgi:hypothetical protein
VRRWLADDPLLAELGLAESVLDQNRVDDRDVVESAVPAIRDRSRK